MRRSIFVASLFVLMAGAGCASPRIKLFPGQTDPLQEFTLEGKAPEKVLLLPIRGVITDNPRQELLRTQPSTGQEAVSHMRKAEKAPLVGRAGEFGWVGQPRGRPTSSVSHWSPTIGRFLSAARSKR